MPFGHDLAAVYARAGAEIDHPVGGANRVLVMFDDDDGVAKVAQAAERGEQAVIVLLVQADAGFVEDVEHARQAAADLAREADALALPAGQGAAGAVKVEIIEADIVEEAEPFVDFLEDRLGNLLLLIRSMSVVDAAEPGKRVGDAHAGGDGDVDARDFDAKRFGFEARAVAGFARLRRLVFAQFLAHPRAVGLQQSAVKIADDALERLAHRIFLAPVLEGQLDRQAAGAVEDDELLVGEQVLPRGVEAEVVSLGEAGQHLHIIRAEGGLDFAHGTTAPFFKDRCSLGTTSCGSNSCRSPKPVAIGACALRGVEGEETRRDFGDGEAGDGAGEFFAEKTMRLAGRPVPFMPVLRDGSFDAGSDPPQDARYFAP